MRIDQNIIDAIKAKADIVEVIGEHVHLTKVGQNYTGLCPFHDDRSPSLTVSPSKGIYKCFACNASGDVIDFLQECLKISFVEAVELLADRYGVDIPKDAYSVTDETARRKRESMYIINDYATKYFEENLFSNTKESQRALAYAKSRWPLEYITSFGIGYANDAWDDFSSWAEGKGLDKDLLLELGLVKMRKDGEGCFDAYRGRIMIPVRDRHQRVIAFTARILPDILSDNPKSPKYINSPTSLLFEKSNCLFGFDVALNAASKAGVMNLVEGAPDVMRLQVIGVANTVASLGSSWTESQLTILKRVTGVLNIIPDSDVPKDREKHGVGFVSAMRTGKLALSLGFAVTVQEIPASD